MKVLAIFNNDRCDLIVECPKYNSVINGQWDIEVDLQNKIYKCLYNLRTTTFDYAEEIEVTTLWDYNAIMLEIYNMKIPETDRYIRAVDDDDHGLGFNIL